MIPDNLPPGVTEADIVGDSEESYVPGVPIRWNKNNPNDPRNEYEPPLPWD